MDLVERKNRRHFTPEARIAALEARRRKTENAIPVETPQMFAVRHSDGRFGWEIRRFGAIVLDRSKTTYENMVLARSAGEAVLTKILVEVGGGI